MCHRRSIEAWFRGGIALLAACGSGPPPQIPTPEPPTLTVDAGVPVMDAAAGTALVKQTASRRKRIEAPHGDAISAIAVTPDGKSVVSADELGGIRLWPALDGSVEPRAVDLPRPQQLAIGREPRGFVIAMIDEVGGLLLQVVDRDGLTIQRASLGIDPPFAGVVMSEQGTIAWRADQRVMRLNADGSIQAQLAAEPGHRILDITVSGPRAVAVIEGGAKPWRRARWLAMEGKLAWGGWIAAGDEVGSAIALSPSGKRLASFASTPSKNLVQAIVIETTTGAVLANEPAVGALALGFADDDHLALGSLGGVNWIDLAKPRRPSQATSVTPVERGILGVGGGRAITSISGELVIATPSKTEFLGYALQSPAVAAAAPGGRMLIGLGDSFALLDSQLQAGPAPDLEVPAGSAIADLRWLAGDDWLVETSRVNDGVTSISLVDVTKHKSIPVRTGMAMVQLLMHDPSTQLVTLSLGELPEVLRHEPGKLKLARVATLPRPAGFERAELVPVTPKLAGGTQLVVVHMRDRLTLRWVRDPSALDKGIAVTIDGSLAGVDPAGTVFVWQNDPQGMLELALFRDGKRIGTLPTDGPTAVWPDPRGGQVIQVGQRSIALVTLDGKRTWAQGLQGVTEALWLDDGSIGIVSAAGIARLAASTGEVIAARCGWRFGLSSKQHPVSPRFEPVCTQLR
jgi:hypothetical protein